jgi:D-xylulose reductase
VPFLIPYPDHHIVFDDEIIVTVQKTGICGSDIHFLIDGRIAHLVVEAPMVLGHESSGIITKGEHSSLIWKEHAR